MVKTDNWIEKPVESGFYGTYLNNDYSVCFVHIQDDPNDSTAQWIGGEPIKLIELDKSILYSKLVFYPPLVVPIKLPSDQPITEIEDPI